MNHYLALGDSYTIGEGVEAAGRWPVQLRKRLVARNIELEPPTIRRCANRCSATATRCFGWYDGCRPRPTRCSGTRPAVSSTRPTCQA